MPESEAALPPSTTLHGSLATAPGIRVLVLIGPAWILRTFTAFFLVAMLVRVGVEYLDLSNPTPLGSDVWNYYAAGERLNAGHDLYALQPGDREVLLRPPYWTVPLLSPPLIAVIWRPLALLPAEVAMTAWWLVGAAALLAVVAFTVLRAPPRTLLLLLLMSPMLAQAVVASNVNNLLVPLLMLAWFVWQRDRRHLAGAAVAVAVAIKLTPIVFVLWFIARRDRPSIVGFGLATGVLAVVSLLGAGLDTHLRFVDIALNTAIFAASPASLPGTLVDLGLPRELGPSTLVIAAAVCGALVVALRSRPRASFAVAAIMAVLISPVVYYQTVALFLVAFTPWLTPRESVEPLAG